MANKTGRFIIPIFVLILILITLFTSYSGSTDSRDYATNAKFFAGEYSAKIRSSHSYYYGLIHSPFLIIMKSFFILKVTSLIFLGIIIYLVYLMSNKNKKAFYLILFSPVVWYMGPWINPIQLASLFLLCSYYLVDLYDKTGKVSNLLYSGLFLGLGWAVWDTILYFGLFLAVAFLYDRKVVHLFYFCIFVLIGMIPRLILDQLLFNFAFYSIIKTVAGNVWATFLGGVYNHPEDSPRRILSFFSVFLAIPFYFWSLYKIKSLMEYKKTMIFLSLSILLILTNPQIRFTLAIIPIIVLLLSKTLDNKQFVRQIIFSIIITLLFITPYIIQINYNIEDEIHGREFTGFLKIIPDLSLSKQFTSELIKSDLEQITKEFRNEVFVVGNNFDDYKNLAYLYWGEDVKEFVSIEDYGLAMNNESTIFKKRFESRSNIQNRRQIWIEGGLDKNPLDATDYGLIQYGLSLDEDLDLSGFKLVKRYRKLSLFEKM